MCTWRRPPLQAIFAVLLTIFCLVCLFQSSTDLGLVFLQPATSDSNINLQTSADNDNNNASNAFLSQLERVDTENVLPREHSNQNSTSSSQQREQQPIQQHTTPTVLMNIKPYSQHDMIRLVQDSLSRIHVLIYHPQKQHWEVYRLSTRSSEPKQCACFGQVVELILDGLSNMTSSSLSRPLQLLLDTVNDYPYYHCMDNATIPCSDHAYPPLLTVGSVPKSEEEAPFLHQLPTKYYTTCLYQWRLTQRNASSRPKTGPCELVHLRRFDATTDRVWKSLLPQVFWRGSALSFLSARTKFRDLKCEAVLFQQQQQQQQQQPRDQVMTDTQVVDLQLQHRDSLSPRCLAVAMTLQAELEWARQNGTTSITMNQSKPTLPWINVKFTDTKRHRTMYGHYAPLVLDKYMSSNDMAAYKYQIDFGGIGGTTWLGTITKLAMPGILFHHETPTKDWFHDEIQPWVHYVPIHTNLSNLYDTFLWAETHSMEAKQIARRARQYTKYHRSPEHYAATFERLFVERLARIVEAYQPQPGGRETVESILQVYRTNGVDTTLAGICDDNGCDFSTSMNETSITVA